MYANDTPRHLEGFDYCHKVNAINMHFNPARGRSSFHDLIVGGFQLIGQARRASGSPASVQRRLSSGAPCRLMHWIWRRAWKELWASVEPTTNEFR